MIKESGLLGLYWRSRQASLEDCGRRAYATLHALQALGYQRYYFLGRSRRDALRRELAVTERNVLATLAKGVNYTDIPRTPIPDLGWSTSLWSGDPDQESYSLSIQCGAYSEYVSNSVALKLPPEGRFTISASPDRAMQAYVALVDIWEPEQAILCEGPIEWKEGHLVSTREPLAQRPKRSTL